MFVAVDCGRFDRWERGERLIIVIYGLPLRCTLQSFVC